MLNELTIPRSARRGPQIFAATACPFMMLWVHHELEQTGKDLWYIEILAGAVLLQYMLWLLRFALQKVYISRTEIRLTLFGKELRHIPIEKLECIAIVRKRLPGKFKRVRVYLGLTGLSDKEIVSREEERLMKNPITKGDVKFGRGRRNWTDSLRMKFFRRSLRNPRFLRDKDVLWIGHSPDTEQLLRNWFPQVEFLEVKNDWL